MPIREYECEDCGDVEEILFISKEEDNKRFVECSKCSGRMLRIMSAANHNIDGYSYKNLYGLKGNKDGKTSTKEPTDK